MRHGGPDWMLLEREVAVLAAHVSSIAARAECDVAVVLDGLAEQLDRLSEPRLHVVAAPNRDE
jgi:hypothetical protein